MKITKQQALVMFDIIKGLLYENKNHFSGYSKKDIMRLLNDIISQQDNTELIQLNQKKINNDESFWD